MPCQNSSDILVQASRRRKAGDGKRSSQRLEARLGHLVDSRSEHFSTRWFAPIYLKWEDTYQTHWIELDRPGAGATTVNLTCPDCGSTIRVRVRSRSAILRYYLTIALIVSLSALVCCIVWGTPTPTLGGAVLALYLSTFRELLGESDYHSALRIVTQSRAGHWLFKPEET